MELMRRYAAGRLAEVFGPSALPVNKEMRVLGLYRAAEQELPFLSVEVKRALAAYAAGVNAFLATRRARCRPNSCCSALARTVADGRQPRLGQADGAADRRQLPRRVVARRHGADDIAGRPRRPLPRISQGRADDPRRNAADLSPAWARPTVPAALPSAVGPHYAWNNWVVDGKRSASGKPLLANDPHLAFGAPGPWYLARLRTSGQEIAGATPAGVPLVEIGHNDHIAWGFTTTTADVEDLFVEKVDPADPAKYLTPDGSASFVTRSENSTYAVPRQSRSPSAPPAMVRCCRTYCQGHGRPWICLGIVGDVSRARRS